MTFATALESWMQRTGFNAPAAAKALDVTAPTIRNWIGGRPNPHARAFLALMDKLESDPAANVFGPIGSIQNILHTTKSGGTIMREMHAALAAESEG